MISHVCDGGNHQVKSQGSAARCGPPASTERRRVEDEVDRAAAALWGLTEEELVEIRRSLEELR